MGYSHYMEHREVTGEVWKAILKDCRKLYRNLPEFTDTAGGYCKDQPLKIGNWTGEKLMGKTLGSKKVIAFNGYPEPLSHESFVLRQKGSDGFSFCKTARKPYDLLVCACLIAYFYHSSPTIDINSDGDWDDWAPALKFVEQVLGAEYSMKFKMEVEL